MTTTNWQPEEQLVRFWFEGSERQRLDRFLTQALGGTYSRSRVQQWIREGRALVEGVPVTKPGFWLERPTWVTLRIPPPRPATVEPEPIPLDVLFENEDVLVINKPAGMVVHPSPGHERGTVVHAALAHAPDLQGVGGVLRPGLVHRLDKDTSGVMILAKNDAAHQFLQDQFRARTVRKEYLGLVDGRPPTPRGRIEAPIERDPAYRKRMRVAKLGQGREAITEYETIETFPKHTLLRLYPRTGRTHQIRVHCAFLGTPIAGDTLYGRRRPTIPLDRHFLHAHRLTLVLPGEREPRTFEAPLPPELERVLHLLRQQAGRR
ncbi:MAG: RluA family pseudouridine synthase [Chloroflexi bacterium]|nr:RluA family pseudouridine synthase [Chloroflexota bacterium]